MKKASAGFTLIELVIVIVILGILAATALPRFINVSGEAHAAAVAGTGGGLASGVQLARAMSYAQGDTTAVDMDGTFVRVNERGWPTGAAADGEAPAANLANATDCVDVWRRVLANGPSVSSDASDNTAQYRVSDVTEQQCTFQYVADTAKTIVYDASNGNVTINN